MAARTLKLRDVCKLINGRAYSKDELLNEGKYPVLRVGNFFTNNNWYYSDLELPPEKYCDTGELLYAWSASFGPRIWEGGRVIFHYHIWRVLPDPALIEQRYLYYFFLWDTERIKQDQGTGTTMIHVGKGSMEDRDIPAPSISDQQRIVAILDEAFEGIATAKANAEKNLQNARELFESRLEEVFSSPGTDWRQKTLGDTCSIARGGSPRPIKDFLTTAPDGVNWVKISDATSSAKYIHSTAEKIKPAGVSRSRLVRDGDFLLSNSMSFGRPYIMRTTGCIHDGWLVLSDYQGSFDQDFLYLLLGSQFAYRQFDRLAAGSTVRNLNIDLASRVRVPVPPLNDQVQIAAVLGDLSEEIDHLSRINQRKVRSLDDLKKSLLHQAFTGAL